MINYIVGLMGNMGMMGPDIFGKAIVYGGDRCEDRGDVHITNPLQMSHYLTEILS